ncbi:thiamine-phosphate kinase [Alicyclobacillus vulcanalis]|uniref:Thiamine-monophosphate kinase n=1 Tax=Alicyclobacillus vulcanalis TaxID=252246 RepID=A0A1N7P4Q5_9BACL|nr:thiamine-phosphate kinase [Alicyclobacillus vulcanalis]SIT05602.1 thiamine-monophosphate kinase [Alicyclobacillus vulcanalis]
MDEFALIRALAAKLPPPGEDVMVPIGDDCAVVEGKGRMAITTDAVVEGVHFRRDTLSPPQIGYRAVAAAVSDIAAMGGHPAWITIALAVPGAWPLEDVVALYDGVSEAASSLGASVVGGDVVSTEGPLWMSITAVGKVDRPVTRAGARPGDVLFVTGSLGGSAAGLDILLGRRAGSPVAQAALIARHRRPTPRIAFGREAARLGATALDDISDGLASELNEIAEASGVRLIVEADRIPVQPEVTEYARALGADPLAYALYGGEDYELVGTAPRDVFARLLAVAPIVGTPVAAIGRVEEGDGVVMRRAGRLEVVARKGYNHFER